MGSNVGIFERKLLKIASFYVKKPVFNPFYTSTRNCNKNKKELKKGGKGGKLA